MTDLDKKVKEVVEEWMGREMSGYRNSKWFTGDWGTQGKINFEQDIHDLAARIQSLCQQDAERREEEAFEAGIAWSADGRIKRDSLGQVCFHNGDDKALYDQAVAEGIAAHRRKNQK